MVEITQRPTDDRDRLVGWALGTFHAATLMIVLILVVYLGGGLASVLGGLSTVSGLALFTALWFTTVWSTRKTLRGAFGIRLQLTVSAGKLIARAAHRGGVNGVVFLPFLGFILAASAIASSAVGPSVALVLEGVLVFATLGVAIAFLAGYILGLFFAGVDLLLLWAARRI